MKYRTWAQAAEAHLSKQILGEFTRAVVETNNSGAAIGVGRTWIEEMNAHGETYRAQMRAIIQQTCEDFLPDVIALACTWSEIERECESAIVMFLTKKMRGCEGPSGSMHRVRVLVPRPYDRPHIYSTFTGGLLVINDTTWSVPETAWPRMVAFDYVDQDPADAIQGWPGGRATDLEVSVAEWIEGFIASAGGETWTLTGEEIYAALTGKEAP